MSSFSYPFSWYPIGSYNLVSSLQLQYRLRERRRSRAMHPPKQNPTKLHCFLTQYPTNLEASQCVGGNTVHLATVSACTVPGPPQESLVRDETRISLLAKPSLTRKTLGQLCVAPRNSRSRQSLGANPESLVAQLALQYSALNHCATREAPHIVLAHTHTQTELVIAVP